MSHQQFKTNRCLWNLMWRMIFFPFYHLDVMTIDVFLSLNFMCASNTSLLYLDAEWFALFCKKLLKKLFCSPCHGPWLFELKLGARSGAITAQIYETHKDFYWNKFNVFFWVVRRLIDGKNIAEGEWRCWRLKVT